MPGYVGYVNKILGLASSYAGLSEPLTAVPSKRSNSPAFYNGSWNDGKPHVGVNTDVPGSLKGAHMSAKAFLENMESYGIPKEIISQIDITKPEDMLPLITAHEMGHHVDHQNRGDEVLSADNAKAKEFKRLRLEAESKGDMEAAARYAKEYRNVPSEKNADTFAFNFIRDKYEEIWPKKDWSGIPKVGASAAKISDITKPTGPYADYIDFVMKKIDEEQGPKVESNQPINKIEANEPVAKVPEPPKAETTVKTEAIKEVEEKVVNPIDIPKSSPPDAEASKKVKIKVKPEVKAEPPKKVTIKTQTIKETHAKTTNPIDIKSKVVLPDKAARKVAESKLDDAAKAMTKGTGSFGKGAIMAVGSIIALASVADYVMHKQDEMRQYKQVQRQEHKLSEKQKRQMDYQLDAYNGPAGEPFTQGLPQFMFNNRKGHSNTWGGQKY